MMCQTPRPKRPKVAAPTKPPPPRAGAAPPPAVETAAASTDATLAPSNNVPVLLKAADAILRTMDPRPKQWSLSKVHKWLEENPIGNGFGREFLLAAVDERLVMAEKAAKETEDELSLFNKKLIGKEPILRLIHALIDDDDIKIAYLVRLDVSSDRMVVENRNTPASKAASVWAIMSRKWNDLHFLPTTRRIDLHSDFYDPIAIDHDVMTPATPEKVKEKWDGLLHELKRGIANWERSGQGDSGYLEEEDEEEDVEGVENEGVEKNIPDFGTLNNRIQRALDSREAFFTRKESNLLYLWEVLEWHGLLVSSMQRLNTFAISTNGADGIPSIINDNPGDDSTTMTSFGEKSKVGTGRDDKKLQQLSQSIKDHATKMVPVARMKCVQRDQDCTYAMQAEVRSSLCSLAAEKRQMIIQMQAEKANNNAIMAKVYSDLIVEIENKEIEETNLLNQAAITTPQ